MSLRYVDLLSCGCAPTICLATGFVAFFPVLRSPAGSGCAGSCGFSSPIWFTTFAMGSPLRGRGWFDPRSERRFGMSSFWAVSSFFVLPLSFGIWSPYGLSVLVGSHLYATSDCHWCLALYPYGWASSLCLRPLFSPCRYRRVSWWSSLRPRVLGCSWLSPVFFPIRCSGSMSTSMALDHGLRLSLVLCSRSFQMGIEPLSEASLRALPLPARFSWWSSLRQRVFGSSWLSPLFFPVRWYGYKTTCIALYPVRSLSFLLGPISFWMGFDPLSETSLCSCSWCVYWWSSQRPRGFESSGLSPVFFPFRGPTPVSRMFLCLRPSRSRSPFPSLAPSWWSPCPLDGGPC